MRSASSFASSARPRCARSGIFFSIEPSRTGDSVQGPQCRSCRGHSATRRLPKNRHARNGSKAKPDISGTARPMDPRTTTLEGSRSADASCTSASFDDDHSTDNGERLTPSSDLARPLLGSGGSHAAWTLPSRSDNHEIVCMIAGASADGLKEPSGSSARQTIRLALIPIGDRHEPQSRQIRPQNAESTGDPALERSQRQA
jgi:hypothetical protein